MTGEPPAPSRAQLFFECPDLDRTVDQLKAEGLVFEQDPTDMVYLWREARLRDPDGHDIVCTLLERTALIRPGKSNLFRQHSCGRLVEQLIQAHAVSR